MKAHAFENSPSLAVITYALRRYVQQTDVSYYVAEFLTHNFLVDVVFITSAEELTDLLK